MSDEIDVESERLEFLLTQKQRRLTDILSDNEGLFWVKPTSAGGEPEEAAPSQAAEAFAKTRRIRRE